MIVNMKETAWVEQEQSERVAWWNNRYSIAPVYSRADVPRGIKADILRKPCLVGAQLAAL